jgi:hypothetical protein
LDLGLHHRRPNPRRLRVRDGSRLCCHIAARVWTGSNAAQGLDAHARWSVARSSGARVWPVGTGGWMGARAREQSSRKTVGKQWWQKRERREEEERWMGSTPTRAALFIGGSTGSTRCGSFRRTTRFNGSIPRSLREDCGGFIVNGTKPQPKPWV